jgi:heparosan-N-sulfate-glucuronate 5-epimerase
MNKFTYKFIVVLLFTIYGLYFFTTYIPTYRKTDIRPYIALNYAKPSDWSREESYRFDKNSIVMVDYGKNGGLQYNPVTIAQYALACFDEYMITKDVKYREAFLNNVQYFKDNKKEMFDDLIGYPLNFKFPTYKLKPPWYSGMAQGHIISVLARAYYLTGDKSLLPMIRKIKNFMMIPASAGGTATRTPEGYIWIELYPSQKPSYVLNGFLFAVFGLYDYINLFPEDLKAREEYRQCLSSIRYSIKFYDTGDWALYDRYSGRKPRPVEPPYMIIHIRQLEQLYRMTGDSFFKDVSKRWLSYYIKRVRPHSM